MGLYQTHAFTSPPPGTPLRKGDPFLQRMVGLWMPGWGSAWRVPELVYANHGVIPPGASRLIGTSRGQGIFLANDGSAQTNTTRPSDSQVFSNEDQVSIFCLASANTNESTFGSAGTGITYATTRTNNTDKSATMVSATQAGGSGNSGLGLIMCVDSSGLAQGCKGSSTLLTDGTIYSLLGTYKFNNTSLVRETYCYVNGRQDNASSENWSLASGNAFSVGGLSWIIGRAPQWANGSGLTIVSCFIWNRVLNKGDALRLHYEPFSIFVDPSYRRYFFYGVQAAAATFTYKGTELGAGEYAGAEIH